MTEGGSGGRERDTLERYIDWLPPVQGWLRPEIEPASQVHPLDQESNP